MEQRIFELELKMEHAQRDVEEIKDLLLTLSHMVHDIQTQINHLIDLKGKSI